MAATNGQSPSDQRPAATPPISPRSAAAAKAADQVIVTQLAHVRDDMAAYDARYPAAVEVRTRLGAVMWERLEHYRRRAAKFAAKMRRLDREELAVDRDFLDECYLPYMQAYVREHVGELAELVFVCHRRAMDSMLEDDAEANVAVQDSLSMTVVRGMFVRRPSLWLLFNMYYPVRGLRGEPGRMNWVQLKDWALSALQNPSLVPSVYRLFCAEEFVRDIARTDGDRICNAALVEVYTDLVARLSEVDGA